MVGARPVADLLEAVYGPDHPEVARTLTNLGNVQQEQGELPATRASLQRALAVFGRVYGSDHPHTVLVGSLPAELDEPPASEGG